MMASYMQDRQLKSMIADGGGGVGGVGGGQDAPLIPGLPDDVALECMARVPLAAHARLRRVCGRWRRLVSDDAFFDLRARAGAAEDVVFLVQALVPPPAVADKPEDTPRPPPGYGVSEYNATSGVWRRVVAPMPMFAQCAAAGRELVVLGGWDLTTLEPATDVRIYDPSSGTWRAGAPMPAERSFFACAADGRAVYVAGGHDSQKNALRSAEAYDVGADRWSVLPAMAEERDECAGAVASGGRLWAVSGYRTDGQGAFEASAEWFDGSAGEWVKEDSMWPPTEEDGDERGHVGAACVVVVKGRMWSVEAGKRGVREWDGKRWKAMASAPLELRSPARAAAMAGGEKVFVVGTAADGNQGVWMMEVSSRKWSRVDTPQGFAGFVFSLAILRL